MELDEHRPHSPRPTNQVGQRRGACGPKRTDRLDSLDRVVPYCSAVLHPKCPIYRRSHQARIDDPLGTAVCGAPPVYAHQAWRVGEETPHRCFTGITIAASQGPS